MDKALKIGKLLAYAAEVVMATLMAKDAIDTISERRKAKEKANDGKTAEAVPQS